MQRTFNKFCNRTSHFNTGRAATNDDNFQTGVVLESTEVFVTAHDFRANRERLMDGLHTETEFMDSWNSKVRGNRTHGNYQVIKGNDLTAIEFYRLVFVVDGDRRTHMKASASFAKCASDGIGDMVRRDSGGRDLVKQR